jgi:succinate dehydrogenase / fumarate reductase cytochrome b subunit
MNWLSQFFTSSIGRKVIMSLTGLFLIAFLLVHLVGNLQMLANDNGRAFNIYTDLMSHNGIIQAISKGLYFFIILHAIQGLLLARINRKSKGQKYAVSTSENATWASRNMALLGTLVLAFILIHMGDFWVKIKFQPEMFEMVTYKAHGREIQDAYQRVVISFQNPAIVLAYILGLIALGFHLQHGFQSAFQTLGLRHRKYTPFIEKVGIIFAIIVPLGFAIIPLYIFFS